MDPMQYKLSLYVTGDGANGRRALDNANDICRGELGGHASLQVIDIAARPEAAFEQEIIATPMLIRERPLPVRRLVGDLSDREQVLRILTVPKEAEHEDQA